MLFPYRPIDQAVPMTSKNYDPNQGTPLYDQSVVLLGTVLAKAQEFTRNGVVARTVTLHHHRRRGRSIRVARRAKDVAALVSDMTAQRERTSSPRWASPTAPPTSEPVFREMGIEDRWILTPGNNPSEIRNAFQVFSQSAVRASQAASFSQGTIGGFTN